MVKEFYFNDIQVGDIYYYDSSGKIDGYRFKDFSANSLIQIDYGSNSRILKENRRALFIDSFILNSNKTEGPYKMKDCDILLIISNPPKCSTEIKICYWNEGKVYKMEEVQIGQYYKNTVKVLYDTDSIIVLSKQYDSIRQIAKYEKSITHVRPTPASSANPQ